MGVFFRVIGKYRQILSRHQKIRIMELSVLMIIRGILDMISVWLIMPFSKALVRGDKLLDNGLITRFCDIFHIETYRGFMVALALIMGFVFLIKNAFMLFEMLIQNRFVFNNMHATQKRLLYAYLMQPYEYYLNMKSGKIISVINSDTNTTFRLLTNLLQVISELVCSTILVIMLFNINAIMTIAMTIMLIILSVLVQYVIRPILQRAGDRNRQAGSGMNQSLVQAIQGIKEVKVMRRENFFLEKFGENGKVYVKSMYINRTLTWSPRCIMEAISMFVFFVVIAILIYRGIAFDKLVPVLSGLIMAVFRLLPAVSRISGNMGNIAYGEPSIDKMIENLKNVPQVEEANLNPEGKGLIRELEKVIQFDHITYQYPTGDVDVLEDANMEIKKGMSVGIIGPSGAGKTTTVDVLLGLLQVKSGKVLVDGMDINEDMSGWLGNIAYIPQGIFMLDGSVRDNVVFGMREEEIDEERVWKALKDAAIDDFVRSLPEGLDTQIGERGIRFSGGQRQRLGIARALYRNPSVLVFDEATSALDNATEAEIMKSINNLHGQKTMIIIAHRLTTIENCDVVYRVENGKISLERGSF